MTKIQNTFAGKPYMVQLYPFALGGTCTKEENPFENRGGLPSIRLPWLHLQDAISQIEDCFYDDTVVLPAYRKQRVADELQSARALLSPKFESVKAVLRYTYGTAAEIQRKQKLMISPAGCQAIGAQLEKAVRGRQQLQSKDASSILECQQFLEVCNGAAGEIYVLNSYNEMMRPGQLSRRLNEIVVTRSKEAANSSAFRRSGNSSAFGQSSAHTH